MAENLVTLWYIVLEFINLTKMYTARRLSRMIAALGLTTLVLLKPLDADIIKLKDGNEITQISNAQELDGVVLYERMGRSYSMPTSRVDRILSDKGRVLFENQELTVEKVLRFAAPTEFVFLKNGQELARAEWGDAYEFVLMSGRIPAGTYRQYFDSGKLERIFTVSNGTLNGVCKVFFENGHVEREGTFRDGQEIGLSRLYYKNGQLHGESQFVNGSKEGETRLYYRSGALKSVMNFQESKPHGVQQTFFESGEIEAVVEFRNGVRHGPIRQYFETGHIRLEGEYNNGQLDGVVTTYYQSGRIKKRQTFEDGRVLTKEDDSEDTQNNSREVAGQLSTGL